MADDSESWSPNPHNKVNNWKTDYVGFASPIAKGPHSGLLKKGSLMTSGIDTEIQQQRKEEHLRKFKEHLEKEKDMLAVGRQQLNKDIQRHHRLMHASIEELNGAVVAERQRFLNEIVKGLERFKLPTAKRLIPTGKLDDMIKESKQIYQDCCNLVECKDHNDLKD